MLFYKIKNENNKYFSYETQQMANNYIKISDPTYDLTFKYLFSLVDNWEKNIGSLLNSLIFSDELKKIELLPNEFVDTQKDINQYGEHLKVLKSDLSYKCKIKTSVALINLLNIEMQGGYPQHFLERLISYGLSLRANNVQILSNKQTNFFKTTVLGFINSKDKSKMESNAYYISKFDLKDGSFQEKVDDFLEVIIINLNDISEKLIKDEEITILG